MPHVELLSGERVPASILQEEAAADCERSANKFTERTARKMKRGSVGVVQNRFVTAMNFNWSRSQNP